MSALVETMMYYDQSDLAAKGIGERFVPWHGLGTPVPEAPTSADAIKLAGLDWTVDSKPVYDFNGKMIPGYYANTRSSDNSVLGIVGSKYKIVQNIDAFEFTDSLIDEGVTYASAGSLKNGQKTWLLAQMPKDKILDDDFENYICFANSFDGTGAIKVCMTPTRVVCSNTLNLALNNAKRMWSTRHVGDMKSKLAAAKETLGLAKVYVDTLKEEADKLANKKISDTSIENIVNTIFSYDVDKDSPRKIANMESLKTEFYQRYALPDIKQYRNTGWGIVNAAADLVDHATPNRITDTYQENNWSRVMTGHPTLDKFYDEVLAA